MGRLAINPADLAPRDPAQIAAIRARLRGMTPPTPRARLAPAVYAHYASFPPPVRAVEAGGDPCFPETVHPTQKPVSLMAWGIAEFTRGRVLDPYMGSGTTGVACIRLGRRFVGVEIDPTYFDVARRRLSAELARPRLPLDAPARAPTQVGMFDGGGGA